MQGCVKCWAEINKPHSDVGVVIFKVCEDWGEGSVERQPLLILNAKWWESKLVAMLSLMCWRSSVLKHTGCATGRQSFRLDTTNFLGTGMMVAVLKQVGTLSHEWDVKNTSNKSNWLTDTHSSFGQGCLSGPIHCEYRQCGLRKDTPHPHPQPWSSRQTSVWLFEETEVHLSPQILLLLLHHAEHPYQLWHSMVWQLLCLDLKALQSEAETAQSLFLPTTEAV